jgi:hypothetical protein
LSAGVIGAFLSLSCGGESTESDGDSGDDDAGGSGGTQGGSGGNTSRGGSTSNGGAGPAGGTSSGGTGGEIPDGTCDDIEPCGGDPEGTWNVRENCTEVLVPGLFEGVPGCENAVAAGSGVLEGTFTFTDGTATQETVTTVSVTIVVDDACAEAFTEIEGVTAADVCPLLDAQIMMDAQTPATCFVTNEGCRCDVTQEPQVTSGTDTYEVAGNRLVLGSGETYDFCVEGDEMGLSGTTVDPDSGATAELMLLLERE